MTAVDDVTRTSVRPEPTNWRARTVPWAAATMRDWRPAALSGVLVTAASITLHLLTLRLMAPAGSQSVWQRLMPWDADLYRQIAQNGYPKALTYDPTTHQLQGSNLAFSPLYPLLERLLHTVIPSWTGTALTLSWVMMAIALALVHRLATNLYGPTAGLPAAVLVGCAQPMAIVFALGYPDGGLYLTLGIAAILGARSKHWLCAGCFAFLAGLTRPTGLAVAATITVMAAAAWRRSDNPQRLFSVAGTLLGCYGFPAWLLWVGLRVHHLDAWFAIQQAGWGTHWDYGLTLWRFITTTALPGTGVDPLADKVVAVIVIGYAVYILRSARRSKLGVLAVWPLTVLVLAIGSSNDANIKPRLLLAAGLCFLPAARWLGQVTAPWRWSLLGPACLLSAWWGAYMLDVWHWAI